MRESFNEIEKEFQALKLKFSRREITESEFKDQLKKLRVKDETGKCWTLGARTGKWYYFDGNNWVESNPPVPLQDLNTVFCKYCGFENEESAEGCSFCGANLADDKITCPECGYNLDEPSQECPVCAGKQKAKEKMKELEEGIGETFVDESGPNFVVRSISPPSLMLFTGAFGLIMGLIFGAFVGASEYFTGTFQSFPAFFKNLQGNILGGIIFGLLGGISGFLAYAAMGFITALLTNLIFSFIGGIKVKIDKLDLME